MKKENRKKYSSGPRYWNVPVLVNTGTFLVYQYCWKMWYLHSLECAGVIQKLTILEHKNGLVLSNTRVPVSGTSSILFPENPKESSSTKRRKQNVVFSTCHHLAYFLYLLPKWLERNFQIFSVSSYHFRLLYRPPSWSSTKSWDFFFNASHHVVFVLFCFVLFLRFPSLWLVSTFTFGFGFCFLCVWDVPSSASWWKAVREQWSLSHGLCFMVNSCDHTMQWCFFGIIRQRHSVWPIFFNQKFKNARK